MANDTTPTYEAAHKMRNASRVVVEGVDEPEKKSKIGTMVPAGYTSPDVEDRRHDEPVTKSEKIQRAWVKGPHGV